MNTVETKINIRIDKKIKEKAQKTLEALGLDLSSGVKLFLHSVIATQSIPFEIRTVNGFMLAQEKEMLKEAQEAIAEFKIGKGKSYASIKAMMEDTKNWDDEGNYVSS